MPLISISNLTFSYTASETIFDNVSFQIDTNWKLGLIGRNGRGKTTFLNLLQRKYDYCGKIITSTNFSYFPISIHNPKKKSISIAESLSPSFKLWRLQKELQLLEVDETILYKPFNILSGGEKTKLMLACLFINKNNFLLIDEPTNHLDNQGRQHLKNYLKNKEGFILVSHDRVLLETCIDYTLAINKADIQLIKGSFNTWEIEKAISDNKEIQQNEHLKKEIKHLQKAAKQISNWSDKRENTKGCRISGVKADKGYIGHKAAKLMKRSKNVEKRCISKIETKTKLLKNIETADKLSLKNMNYKSKILATMENVSVYYSQIEICKNININLITGSRIAIIGKNGSGKSTILKLLAGDNIAFNGEFYMPPSLKISYIPQDVSFLKGPLHEFAFNNQIDESLFKAILRKMGFERYELEYDISTLSHGQKKKILIAKSLCHETHLYIWDEPLNFVDIISRMQIEDAILESNPTMIFTEHDETFVNKIATQVIYL